jgi:hypothetical protein
MSVTNLIKRVVESPVVLVKTSVSSISPVLTARHTTVFTCYLQSCCVACVFAPQTIYYVVVDLLL